MLMLRSTLQTLKKGRMMKTRLVTSLISLALSAFVASSSSAQASLVAGWDFSQYAGDGFMSIDGGGSFTNTLPANYSDLDPTFGAGFESGAFGTMFADGQFGSTVYRRRWSA